MSKKNLVSHLNKLELALTAAQNRYYFLLEFEKVQSSRLVDGPIPMRNDIIVQMMRDTFDMLVNDIVSFCESMVEHGGFFEKLKKLKAVITLLRQEEITPPEPNIINIGYEQSEQERDQQIREIKNEYIRRILDGQKETLSTLFPGLKSRRELRVTEKDVNKLILKFKEIYASVKKYRNHISAHRFERKSEKPRSLSLDEIGKSLDGIQHIMNAIRVVLDSSSFAYMGTFRVSPVQTSEDLLDLMFTGSQWHLHSRLGLREELHSKDRFDALRSGMYKEAKAQIIAKHAKGQSK